MRYDCKFLLRVQVLVSFVHDVLDEKLAGLVGTPKQDKFVRMLESVVDDCFVVGDVLNNCLS